MKFNARLDTSHHGPQHPFRDVGVLADSLTGIRRELHTRGSSGAPTGKNPEDSHMVSAQAMQWFFFHLSIGHDGCYSENIAQHG
jgi:hypothetical protein